MSSLNILKRSYEKEIEKLNHIINKANSICSSSSVRLSKRINYNIWVIKCIWIMIDKKMKSNMEYDW